MYEAAGVVGATCAWGPSSPPGQIRLHSHEGNLRHCFSDDHRLLAATLRWGRRGCRRGTSHRSDDSDHVTWPLDPYPQGGECEYDRAHEGTKEDGLRPTGPCAATTALLVAAAW